MDFEYQYNEQYRFSQQSFGIGLLSRRAGGGWSTGHRHQRGARARSWPRSDPYADALVEREFDYGAGVGGRALARVEHRGTAILSAGYRGYWTATLNGASQSKFINFVTVEARAPLPFGLAVGRCLQPVPAAQQLRRPAGGDLSQAERLAVHLNHRALSLPFVMTYEETSCCP